MAIHKEGPPWTEIWTTNESDETSPVLTVEMLEEIVARLKSSPRPIRPAVADDGSEWYIAYGERLSRERMIQYMPGGWTWRAVTFAGYRDVVFDACPIEWLER